ncbi:flagellar motor switch protein FliG [Aestuariicoccus sp. MJ-SS9]|uniref:flagellar motor switch protein FliG n=1 Tax=Aestuariicoccus sp. MJ-SS9 TaxID=3079855 RepID=UPI00290F3C5F|nr:FliG C-terminal domain-containing protein [Aestuariicoccus sp. MJ-SS9]MDU8913625.1 FliG C-terminal domain-containing protein [Aestuariicoccus sp. MJ-SS9]
MTFNSPVAALPSPGAGGHGPLSRRAKAAIVVQFLLNEGADVPLAALPEDLQAHLTQQLGTMRYVDRTTLEEVVREFADELESVGMALPGDMAGALDALEGKISPRTAMRLRKEAGVRQSGDPWERINTLDVDRLLQLVQSESTEIAAVLLSKIQVDKAAAVLGRLPGDRAQRITYAVSMTSGVTPDAVDRIGLSLASQLDAERDRAFSVKPDQRVGAILNYSLASVRDDVLDGLQETDHDFAEAVRRAIFTFANIPHRLKPLDVPKITRDVDADVLATAIAAAEGDEDRASVAFILDNMSKRLAATLREEATDLGKVRRKQGEAAMNEIVSAIRNLVDMGEIELVRPEEDEDE